MHGRTRTQRTTKSVRTRVCVLKYLSSEGIDASLRSALKASEFKKRLLSSSFCDLKGVCRGKTEQETKIHMYKSMKFQL